MGRAYARPVAGSATMTGSATKQSISPLEERWIACASLAMTWILPCFRRPLLPGIPRRRGALSDAARRTRRRCDPWALLRGAESEQVT